MSEQFTANKGFIGDTIGTDTILINLSTGAYYAMTPLGGAVWAKAVAGEQLVDAERSVAVALVHEGILETSGELLVPGAPTEDVFLKYTDMSELLMADPIHEVDEDGWPKLK
ncbi:MAG: hypothetical protein ACOYBP_06235 [Microbacteriaceae bacterium]